MAERRCFDGEMPMNRDATGLEPADDAAIDLARERPFALAHLTVTPAALQVDAPGWSQRLEPRAMQMLVALAQAAPAVVGRDALNARVWGGRVVGNDAINRAVQTLRRVAADAPAPLPFTIGTVPRVGYRLTVADAAESPIADPLPTAPDRSRRLGWAVAALALLLLAAIVGWRTLGHRTAPADWRIVDATAFDDLPPGAADVTLSPDGRRLAYRGRDAAGRERIFVRTAAVAGAGSPVSPAGLDARRPAWHPDSATLAFVIYDPGQPCRIRLLRPGRPAAPVAACETVRDPRLAWRADGRALLFGDAPGENAVRRIVAVDVADAGRTVVSNPPGDMMGDELPIVRAHDVVFQRVFGWADEGWVAHDATTGRERPLWRRRGVAGSVAAPLPDGTLAIAWTRAGASGIDLVGPDGRVRSQPVASGPVTALSAASGPRLIVETDRSESALARPGLAQPLATVRGRIAGAALLPDGRLRVPVTAAGVARIWESDAAGTLRPWGGFSAARISGVTPAPDDRHTAALVTGDQGRAVVLFDAAGRPVWRWNPHARSVNPAAWRPDGRRLVVPVLDGVGWRLFELDPFGRGRPRDLGLPGFAVLLAQGDALYAVRAGETTGVRELWRLDGRVHRLPVDLTLFDIINWRPTKSGIWLPDRSDRAHPRLVLREAESGRILRSVEAPGLAGAGSGLAADARGPVYVQTARDAPEYGILTLAR